LVNFTSDQHNAKNSAMNLSRLLLVQMCTQLTTSSWTAEINQPVGHSWKDKCLLGSLLTQLHSVDVQSRGLQATHTYIPN